MSQEKVSDPWEEIEGLPSSLKSFRPQEPMEPAWRRTVLDLIHIGFWLDIGLRVLNVETVPGAFGSEVLGIAERASKKDPDGAAQAAYQMFRVISEVVRLEIEQTFPALKLHRALCYRLLEEIEALRTSEPGGK